MPLPPGRVWPASRYALGPRLVRLGECAGRLLGASARPHLARLVDALGESANLAMLDGDGVVYVAHVPSTRSIRMFTEVGRRVDAHCTAVGTEHTITRPRRLLAEIARVRDLGYALDDGEQERGVRCVAVPVPGTANRLAVSVSGPVPRMTHDVVTRAVPLLRVAAEALGRAHG
jgi:IclR family acetate operon transcriptional repressor